jgi:hypothetical protein
LVNFPGAGTVIRYCKFAIMGVWSQIAEYLYLKKKDPNRPKSKWIGYMHGINRISLLIFILCLIILAIKLLT